MVITIRPGSDWQHGGGSTTGFLPLPLIGTDSDRGIESTSGGFSAYGKQIALPPPGSGCRGSDVKAGEDQLRTAPESGHR
jgi:hypothetical protein